MIAYGRAPVLQPAVLVLALLCGCKDGDDPPNGYCQVKEHVLWAPSNDPPIESELDCSLLEVDGAPPKRIPRIRSDEDPDALVPAGFHHFKAKAPLWRAHPSDAVPHEFTFDASVESGKKYYLAEKDAKLVFVEVHAARR
jgi:hypothetical protein